MSKNRDKAIELANRYKEIEKEVADIRERYSKKNDKRILISDCLKEAAVIANRLRMLGYSLPELIRKRQERENDNQNHG